MTVIHPLEDSRDGARGLAHVLIIGAGIAGASAAYFLASRARVTLLEAEAMPGYHSTGRSAALYFESYGSPQVRQFTLASREFLLSPPQGFCEGKILTPRGAIIVAAPGQENLLEEHWQAVRSVSDKARLLSAQEVLTMVPVLKSERVIGAVLEPDAMDIDVHTLHSAFLSGAKKMGAQLHCSARVTGLQKIENTWHVSVNNQQNATQIFQADVIVNAAGAWADKIAELAGAQPKGLVPMRRSAFTFDAPAEINATAVNATVVNANTVNTTAPVAQWPAVVAADESWYFKPDAGQMLGSPANADPVHPHDVQAEEIDIATAIDHIEHNTTLQIRRPRRVWAGLRTFAPDKNLINAWDPAIEGFYWCAGQGGYGIQTSVAMGRLVANTIVPDTV